MPEGRSPDDPMPVRSASWKLQQWISRLGWVWVEGQIAQLQARSSTVYLTLRDVDADMSIRVSAAAVTVRAAALQEGHRVVAHVKCDYFARNGSLTWKASEFRPVGVGALMQRLEQLRKTLAAEGLFGADRKQPLPFLPDRVGLVCGRGSAARHDVEVNARRQWPATVFEVREVAVQGPEAATQVMQAVAELDQLAGVDVIVITRGGGSFEDLLPFSNEALVRVVSDARTPVVSAIGHEEDEPLLDRVADRRASTPTAAGRMVVPELAAEIERVTRHRERGRQLVRDRVGNERHRFEALRRRPVLASPAVFLREQQQLVDGNVDRIRRCVAGRLDRERARLDGLRQRPVLARPQQLVGPRRQAVADDLAALRRCIVRHVDRKRESLRQQEATLRALSPQGTLDRGYAVVRTPAGELIRGPRQVAAGQRLGVRVATGSFDVDVAPGTGRTTSGGS